MERDAGVDAGASEVSRDLGVGVPDLGDSGVRERSAGGIDGALVPSGSKGTGGTGGGAGAVAPADPHPAQVDAGFGSTGGTSGGSGGASSGGNSSGGASSGGNSSGGASSGGSSSGGASSGGSSSGGTSSGGNGSGGNAAPSMGGDPGMATPSPGPGEVAIVELLINPLGTDTGREWIEIINRSGRVVSLVNLHVADAANDAPVDFGGTAGGPPAPAPLLEPGARAILIQSGDPTKNGGITFAADAPGGTFGTLVSLNNDADTISICVGACATGILLDRVSWDASLGAGYDGHALVIDEMARRCPAVTPFGTAGSFGTPFAPNPTCP